MFIRGPLLKFVAKATAHEDPDLSQLLNDLLLIKVDVFEIDREERDKVKSIMEKASKKLDSKKWERMVRVKKRREHAEKMTQQATSQGSIMIQQGNGQQRLMSPKEIVDVLQQQHNLINELTKRLRVAQSEIAMLKTMLDGTNNMEFKVAEKKA